MGRAVNRKRMDTRALTQAPGGYFCNEGAIGSPTKGSKDNEKRGKISLAPLLGLHILSYAHFISIISHDYYCPFS